MVSRPPSPLGRRIEELRAPMTQTELATRAGVSVDLIQKVEQGQRHTMSMPNLHKVARALDVDPSQLLAKTISLPSAEENSGVVAIRESLTRIDHLIGDEPPAEPLTVDEARRIVTYAWGAYWSGNLEQLGSLLPGLITRTLAMVRELPATEQAEAHDVAGNLFQLVTYTLVQLGHPDLAHLAVGDGLQHAENGADPLRAAVLRCTLSWLLLTQGRYAEAHRLATATAANVAPSGGSPLPHWSVYGSLLLTGATAYGRAGDRPGARVLLAEAHEAAALTGNRNDYESSFGPDMLLLQTVDVEVVTENYVDALTAATGMRPEAALPLAARARHLSDVALAHTKLGNVRPAIDAVRQMHHIAPLWTSHQALPTEIVRELREQSCPPELRELARNLHAG
jgi:transcriptional regulator with XRE-family HTH domain